MDIAAQLLQGLGADEGAARFQWLKVDGWMFSNGGKWHFFRAGDGCLVSLCRRHRLPVGQDLAREGWRSTAACPECLAKFRKLSDAAVLPAV